MLLSTQLHPSAMRKWYNPQQQGIGGGLTLIHVVGRVQVRWKHAHMQTSSHARAEQ